jgi:hypothetical protein
MTHRFHLRAESVTVDTDEGRFCLIITDADEGRESQIDIHDCVLEFFKNAMDRIGEYAAEAQLARATMSRADYLDSPQPVRSRPVSVEDAIEAGYALDDPKSPGYHDRMVD